MKKALSWVLAFTMAIAAGQVVFAQIPAGNQPANSPAQTAARTITQTALEGGAPTSTAAKTINVGDTVDILFQKSAFIWSGEGAAYSFEKLLAEWIKISSTGSAFELVGTIPNTETGQLTVRLKAAKAYSGTLTVHLNSGQSATAAWSATITVEDPKQKAAEEEAKRLEEQRKADEQSQAAERQRILDEQSQAAERQRILDEQSQAAERQRILDEQSQAAERQRILDEQSQAAERQRILDEQSQAAERQRILDEQSQAAERQRILDEQSQAAEQQSSAPESSQSERSFWPFGSRRSTNGSDDSSSTSETASESSVPEPPAPANDTPQQPAAAPVSGTLNGTLPGGGTISTSLTGTEVYVGTQFTVTFEDALAWSGIGGNDISAFRESWATVVCTPVTSPNPITIEKAVLDNGVVTVHLLAAEEFSGSFEVYLDSDGSSKTKSYNPSIRITQNPNRQTMTGTVAGMGNPSSTASSLAVNQRFDVVFESSAFDWTGTGQYDFTPPVGTSIRDWVKLTSSTASMPFVVEQIIPSESNGSLTVRLYSPVAYAGTLSVSLESAAGRATKVLPLALTVAPFDNSIVKTKSGGTVPTASVTSPATVDVGEKLYFTFAADNFEWDGTTNQLASSLTDASWIRISGGSLNTNFLAAVEPTTDSNVRVSLTPISGGTYRNLTVWMQGGGGAITTTSAPIDLTVNAVASGKITGIQSGAQLGGTYSGALLNGKAISYGELGNLEVNGGDELLLPLYGGFFTWSGTAPHPASMVSKTQLNSGKIRVIASGRSGSRAFSKTEPQLYYSNGHAYIKLEFSEDYTNTRDIDFEMTIMLTVDGKRHSDSALLLAGTLVRRVYTIYDSYSYYDLSDGDVVEADAYLRNVELYLGEGVTVIANLSRGRKYSGSATTEMSSSDESLFRKYPELDHMYTLNTSGFGTNCQVTLDVGNQYYVYDEKLEYIGMSNEKLPYSHKYYLASKRMYFDEFDEFDEDDDDDYEPDIPLYPTPNATIDSTATQNSNANPRSGR